MKFRFGKYKGLEVEKCTDESYLKWLVENNIAKGKLKYYIQKKYKLPKNSYIVTVNNEKEYKVIAYNTKDAIYVCNKQYNIQKSQHGVNYNVKQI